MMAAHNGWQHSQKYTIWASNRDCNWYYECGVTITVHSGLGVIVISHIMTETDYNSTQIYCSILFSGCPSGRPYHSQSVPSCLPACLWLGMQCHGNSKLARTLFMATVFVISLRDVFWANVRSDKVIVPHKALALFLLVVYTISTAFHIFKTEYHNDL